MKMKRFLLGLCLCSLLPGCSYTVHTMKGAPVAAEQIRQIKLGQTTTLDLLRIFGSPSARGSKSDGTQFFIYSSHLISSPTLPGGKVIFGFFEKEEAEDFEIILKNGTVQSYHFIR
jgi:hypothetical protein